MIIHSFHHHLLAFHHHFLISPSLRSCTNCISYRGFHETMDPNFRFITYLTFGSSALSWGFPPFSITLPQYIFLRQKQNNVLFLYSFKTNNFILLNQWQQTLLPGYNSLIQLSFFQDLWFLSQWFIEFFEKLFTNTHTSRFFPPMLQFFVDWLIVNEPSIKEWDLIFNRNDCQRCWYDLFGWMVPCCSDMFTFLWV